jgi:hypothetical protein
VPEQAMYGNHWRVVEVLAEGAMLLDGQEVGPYWAGPITVEGP